MSEYKCTDCGSYRKPDPASFKSGDKVSFATQRPVGRSIRMKHVDGVVVEADETNLVVSVRKERVTVARTAVTYQNASGPLTYQIFGVCRCAAKAAV